MDARPGTVAWIAIAPVKAMALVHLPQARIERSGIRGDRAFAVVDEDLHLVNGKRIGALATIRPTFDTDAGTLSLRLPDGRSAKGEVVLGASVEPIFFGHPRPAHLVDGPWSALLSDWAARPLRLVALAGAGTGIDRGPSVSLLSTGALEMLAAAGGVPGGLDGRRFRMSIGFGGTEPFVEDGWLGRDVQVGDARVRPVDYVGRCAVTTQDPDTGIPDFPTLHVLQHLRGHISSEDEDLPCGVWAEVVSAGDVRLGDPVRPLDI